MKRFSTYSLFVFLMFSTISYGQISPGELSKAHAELEGMSNCTQCHDLGKKVSNTKCLDCHKELKLLVQQKKGFHAQSTVKNKDCFECHSDHHGRKFEMIRFDEDKFDHNLTGYELEGQHAAIDCRDCHVPENIQNLNLRKRENTFLGLEQKCLSCHDDYHQSTMSNDCSQCHTMEAFTPATKFDHDETNYKLKGKHKDVDCKLCHEPIIRKGKEFQQFADVRHNNCIDCHVDPHNNKLKNKCSQCHTENSFNIFIGKNRFNHNTTNFTLKGKHKTIDCFECHTETSNPKSVFQDKLSVSENNCASCHEDVHKGKFGSDCAKCHSEKSFLSLKAMDFFDHRVTDFPLAGRHIDVDCKKCHTERYSVAIDFSACKNCHDDYHQGEFEKNGNSPDCIECHSLIDGFEVSLFTIKQHQSTEFPLEGAHLATPCFACHVSEDKWTFNIESASCTECHKNVHEDRFEIDGVTTCERCHDADSWFPSKFDHNETAFALEGKHAEIDCLECHNTFEENGKTIIDYKIEKFECIDCH